MVDIVKYKGVIFDCDGVILQSNEIKTNAFRDALVGEKSDSVDEFVAYHKRHGGVSRYVKFEHFYKEVKRDEDYLEKSRGAVSRYAEIVYQALLTVPYVPGFIDLLNYLNNTGVLCFIVSGGDQQELRTVFQVRQLADKFSGIFGSPIDKYEHVGEMINKNNIDYPVLYFGDARVDMEVAERYNMDFCFVSQFSEWETGRDIVSASGYGVINNFEDIHDI